MQVVEIGAAEVLAGVAGAGFVQRVDVVPVFGVFDFDVAEAGKQPAKVEVFSGSNGTQTYDFHNVFSGIGLWDFLCVSFSNDGTLKFYKNGLSLGNYTNISMPYKKVRTKQYLGISNHSSSDPPLKGALDDLRIYNRALTDDEVRALYCFK